MNKQELLKIAKQHRIDAAALSRGDIIRGIQRAEGNFDCYATANRGECDQPTCAWRKDCLAEAATAAAA